MNAAEKIATGQITFAARDSDFDGLKIKKNDLMAMENGKIMEHGNHNELMDRKGKYYKLYTNQFYNKMLNIEDIVKYQNNQIILYSLLQLLLHIVE